MPRIRPIPETTDPAQLRLELELLHQRPVPGPDQLNGALSLLQAVDSIPADQWKTLRVLPLSVDAETLDIAIPSGWGEPEWQALINALPKTGRTVRLHAVLQQDLDHALSQAEPSPKTSSVEAAASSFLEGFQTEGVLETIDDTAADVSQDAMDLEASLEDADASPVVALVS